MSKLQQLLRNIQQGNSSNFEQTFEKMNLNEQTAIMNAIQDNAGIVKHIGDNNNQSAIFDIIQDSVGDLNLTITRVSANINQNLPFILFGAADYTAGYISTFNGLLTGLPGTISVAVSYSNLTGNVIFTYTDSDSEASDTITVSNLGNINYAAFLASMNQNYFKTRYMLISISDENYNLTQFAQPLFYGELSSLGNKQANQLVFRSRTNSWQFRKDRVEVVMPEQKIVPSFSFAMSIIPVASFSIGFDIFMSDRANLNKV